MSYANEAKNSIASITVITGDNFESPELALQLGFAMIYGKPIVLVVEKKVKLPDALIKIASFVQRVDMDNDTDMHNSRRSLQVYLESLKYGGPASAPRFDA